MVREATRRAIADAEDNARRTGVSRRAFLRSACGAATVLLALEGCSRESSRSAGERPGGTFRLPTSSTLDAGAADSAIGGDGFVMDVQNHLLAYDLSTPDAGAFGTGFPQANCGEADKRACFSVDHYLNLIFAESDTTVSVLSAVPAESAHAGPLSVEVMQRAQGLADQVCGSGRLLIHGQAVPNAGPIQAALDDMATLVQRHRISAWKVYTSSPGPGWRLDRGIGTQLVEQAARLGVPRICVHKGIAGGDVAASPVDIGPAAKAHPDVSFIVYHSGWEPAVREGAFDPARPNGGVDRLLASMRAADVGPNQNVYAELGTTWFNLMRSPTEAAHVLGKLMLNVGEDNVVWGTDSIWYGSPQGQLQAFRAFEISDELQERFGYPALTPERKAKILGRNSARLYGIDPSTVRCTLTSAEREQIRTST